MSQLFKLPTNISITENVIAAIRMGCPATPGMPDPVASIELLTPVDNNKSGYWVLGWFSKRYASSKILFNVQDIQLALSDETQARLQGKIVDIDSGRIVITDSP